LDRTFFQNGFKFPAKCRYTLKQLRLFHAKTFSFPRGVRCHEAAFNVLATPIRTAKQLGYHFDSRVLDIENVDLATGKMMDQVPLSRALEINVIINLEKKMF
jgi:hypothetical protein